MVRPLIWGGSAGKPFGLRTFLPGAQPVCPSHAPGDLSGADRRSAGRGRHAAERRGGRPRADAPHPCRRGGGAALELRRNRGAAGGVAPEAGGGVVLLRQYRHAAGGFLWELPAGILASPDEAPEACAARELREEAGLVAARLRRLGAIFTT